MKISKTLLQSILIAVTIGTIASCTKSVAGKSGKQADVKKEKTDSTQLSCPACGMG